MKHSFQKITLLLVLVTLAFSACKKDSNGNGDCGTSAEFPFMATGHQITYAYDEFFGSSGDYTHTYGELDSDGNFKIGLSGNPKPDLLTGIDFFYHRACGDKFESNLTPSSGSLDNWQYKANAQVGESWSYQIDGGGTANYSVVETGLTVNTLAGAIPDCAKITYNQVGTFNTDTVYWSDAVGWVKYDGFLLSYELKSKNF